MNHQELEEFVGSLNQLAITVNGIATTFERIEHEASTKRGISPSCLPLHDMRQEIMEGLIKLRREISKVIPSEKQLKEDDRLFNRLVSTCLSPLPRRR